MSLFSTLSTGVTGLGVNSISLAVAGDNLANLNTVGFKGSRAQFQDLIIADVAGSSSRSQLGLGAFLGGVNSQFSQGSITTTGRSADLAVDGSGLFVVSNEDGTYYTRAGSFSVDAEGRITTLGGFALQGYTADESGNVGSSLGDMYLTPNSLAPAATEDIVVTANLDSESEETTGWGGTVPTTHEAAADEATYTTSMTVYDSLGQAHEVIYYFQLTDAANNTWEYYATVDAGETGGTEGETEVAEWGTLAFDTDGSLATLTQGASNAVTFTGADAQTFAFDFGDPTVTTAEGALTQYASASTVTGLEQDGFGAGDLIDWQIDPDGTVRGVYSNGHEQVLGQIALAMFASADGLERAGDNLWMATENAGAPLVGAASSGGRGSVYQYALESSNVDIESEFVNMITAQRGYQAAARVVATTDQMLQELVNIV